MMSDSKLISNHVGFFFLLFFCISTSFKLCCSILVCPEIEKQALLKFKNSLSNDPSNILSSWNISTEDNCCMWKGVVCSNLTGHVHQLHLQGPYRSNGLRGEVNPSLLNLKELNYLDLSQNYFGEMIPSFIGLLTNLEYLNLSWAGFHGTIPHNIGNLSNLHTLSLDGNDIDADSMEWLFGLSGLEYLNMNSVNLSKVANWVRVINTLPSLVELYLSYCSLNSMAPLKHVNTTSLTVLHLSWNKFNSITMPRWIFQLPNLISLDLSYNYFEGPIPSSINTTTLEFINLSYNNLNSPIPDWLYFCKHLEYVSMSSDSLHGKISNAIGNLTSLSTLILSNNKLYGNIPRDISSLCKMQYLDLYMNNFGGEVSEAFGNMSDCFLEAMTSLTLRYNNLSGHLTPQFVEFKSLQLLDLTRNSISGAIPINIGKLSTLNYLYLDNNKLSGNLPESVGHLLNLTYLDISDNMLEGVVTENHFSNLSKLRYLYASGNHLSLKISSNWVPPFTLEALDLGSWDLGSKNIPLWIQTQNTSLSVLDLSNTSISGNIPTWVWEFSHLERLYLSDNRFSGSLPRIAKAGYLLQLDLSNNSFTGDMSHFLCDTIYATYQLEFLLLGRNQLTGELPDCFISWPSLIWLNLANNNLSGKIPNSIGFLKNMKSFNLQGNKFWGPIPFSMQNCTKLLKLDLGGNGFSGNIPAWMGTSFGNLMFLILRSNKFGGEIPSDICHLNALQILDLSNNVFSGPIPDCVDNFTTMLTYDPKKIYPVTYAAGFFESALVATKGREYNYDTILYLVTNIDLSNNDLSGDIPKEFTDLMNLRSLNLAGNQLTGSIPDRMGNMKQLESLDLSKNSLSGEIPQSFTLMFSLNYLDLSFNNLTGRIPSSTQIMGMDASRFVGNHLCGPPLPTNCSKGDSPPSDDDDDESKIEWLYVFLSLGYAVGLSACCTALVLKKSWRDAYFGMMECIWNKLYFFFALSVQDSPQHELFLEGVGVCVRELDL